MGHFRRVFRLEIWKREIAREEIGIRGEGKFRLGGKGKRWTFGRVVSCLGRWDSALNSL
jgi:hypothetical protein